MKRSFIICLFMMAACLAGRSQVNILFVPEVAGRTIDGLGLFQVQNLSGGAVQGNIVIDVRENKSRQKIVTITTPVSSFASGISNLPRSVYAGSAFNFASNAFASIANQTKNFPPGDYSFCFSFIAHESHTDLGENCYDAEILPLVPLTLIYPADKDRICETRPNLSWQPPIPFHPSMKFRLLLAEKKQGEPIENLLVNAPILLLDNISSTTINYPSGRPALQEGKTYVWQVLAQQSGIVVSKSEIWEFTVQCNEPAKQLPNDSYRELKSLMNGNYYIANRSIRFSFTNHYNVKRLQYTISDIENGGKKIQYLPEVKIIPGLNKIDIDLTEAGLIPGKHYLLKVYPFNEPSVEIRVIYKDEDPS